MPAYCAVPTTPPPWPGVVVIHDITGMSHDLRAQADWLAGQGFLAVAPDLYYWSSRLGCLRTIMRDLGKRAGRSFDDIEAARTWLGEHAGCSGRIGVIGFCMGGGYALALAPDSGYSAASVNYGGCPPTRGLACAGVPHRRQLRRCRRLAPGREAGKRLDRLLDQHQVPHDVKIYPASGTAS